MTEKLEGKLGEKHRISNFGIVLIMAVGILLICSVLIASQPKENVVKYCRNVTQEQMVACWSNITSLDSSALISKGMTLVIDPLHVWSSKLQEYYESSNFTITEIYNDFSCDKVTDEGVLELRTCRRFYNLSEVNFKIQPIFYSLVFRIDNNDYGKDFNFKYKLEFKTRVLCKQNVTEEVCD